MTAQHPLLRGTEAEAHVNYVGSCDWGHCDGETTALRWEINRRRYLAVCEGHERGRGSAARVTAAPKETTTAEPCWDRGPRVGNEGVLRCVLPKGHAGEHRPDESWHERGWPSSSVVSGQNGAGQ